MKFHLMVIVLIAYLSEIFAQKVQLRVGLDSIEFGLADKDQLSIKYDSIDFPNGLSKLVECDSNQKVSIKFSVRDLSKSEDITVQQALIYFVNEKTNDEIVYIADQDRASKVYSKDINLNYKGRDFNYQSGDYAIRLVVGDAAIEKSINWLLGRANIQFSQEPLPETSWLTRYLVRPEIVHQFRQAEKRPPVVVSHAFTLLCLSPVLVMIVCWSKIGLNFSKFTFSFSGLLFHTSLLLIFILYTLFFIKLNMFQTIKCLSGVVVLAFLSGYVHLKNLASK